MTAMAEPNAVAGPTPVARSLDYDVVVIGAGLAGLVAAAAAAAAGARVGVVSRSPGNLALWSGLVAGVRGRSRAAAEAVAFFLAAAEAAGVPYQAAPKAGPNLGSFRLISASGKTVEACLAPRTMAGGDVGALTGQLLVVGFTELADYPAGIVAANAAAATGLSVEHRSLSLGTQAGRGASPHAARLFDDAAWFGGFAESAGRLLGTGLPWAKRPGAVAFPPVLGVYRAARNVEALREAIGRPVFELPALPPSVPGHRFWVHWRHALEATGRVSFHLGRTLASQVTEGARCLWVSDSAYEYRARAFVLATGGVAGGGIVIEPRAHLAQASPGGEDGTVPVEPLFGATTAGRGTDWAAWGVVTRKDGMIPGYDNVFAAGWQVYGGEDAGQPNALDSIQTGYLAGTRAAGLAQSSSAKSSGKGGRKE